MKIAKFNIIIPPQDIECNPQCLSQIATGDRKAYEWLYKNYCSKLYNYLHLLTNDASLSEDLVQDVFLKIWKNRETLTTITNFNSYIHITAKNLLLDKWRRSQNEKQTLKNIASSQPQIEHNLFYQRNEKKTINTAINTLSQKQELIYRLIREEGQTREQISKQLKLSPNTVKATMQNALSNLRKQLCKS